MKVKGTAMGTINAFVLILIIMWVGKFSTMKIQLAWNERKVRIEINEGEDT
jgi:hypothetical protein